jgi:peptide methionine sulfoxide reductase msrA/msrB
MKTIYLAGGCFWGIQKYLSLIPGVKETAVGYANGPTENPSYKEVCKNSGHAETVRVVYDENTVTLTELLDLYAEVIDPVSVNKQGEDTGIQYRTGIYYEDGSDRPIISGWLTLLQESLSKPVAIELAPLQNFYPAEAYHQNYLDKNPGGYCHIPAAKFDKARGGANQAHAGKDELRKQLTPMQYEVAVGGATEPPFENEYYNNFEQGIYVDVISGKPLFISTDKFESGCGWPAFSKPIDAALLTQLRTIPTGGTARKSAHPVPVRIWGMFLRTGPKNLAGCGTASTALRCGSYRAAKWSRRATALFCLS